MTRFWHEMNTLSTECRHILFWFIAMPGDKPVSGLRDLAGIDCGSPRVSNARVESLCAQLSHYLVTGHRKGEVYGGVSLMSYRLATSLAPKDLRSIAMEGEMNGWWPDLPAVRRLCDSSWMRAMLVEDKSYYDGQASKVFAVMQGVRQLLLGRGEIPEKDNDLETQLALAWHWLSIVSPNDDVLDVADPKKLPVGFAVRVLDLAFAHGRNIARSLAGCVARCSSTSCGIRIHEALELASLCVWAGQRNIVPLLLSKDFVDRAAIGFLTACAELPNAFAVANLSAAAVENCAGERRQDFAYCIAWRLLGTTAMILAGLPHAEIAKVAMPQKDNDYWQDMRNFTYPPASAAIQDLLRMCSELETLAKNGRHPKGADWHWTFECHEKYDCDVGLGMPSACLFILYAYLRREGVKLDRATTLPLVRLFRVGGHLVEAGYATMAGIIASMTIGLVDAQQSLALANRVEAADGLWLFPYKAPASDWRRTLEALSQALPKKKSASRGKDTDRPITGCFVWGLALEKIEDDSSLYCLNGIVPGVRMDGEFSCRAVDAYEAARPMFSACRTPQDDALLCSAAYFRDKAKAEYRREVMDLLFAVPHVARVERRYGDYYDRESMFRFDAITLKRGELTLKAERQSDGGVLLSIPEWCVGFDGDYCFHREDDRTYVYYALTTAQKRLRRVFVDRGTNGTILLPPDADAGFRTWLARAADVALVEGDVGMAVLSKSSQIRHVDADPKPVIRLVLEWERLVVTSGVKPYAGAPFEERVKQSSESIVSMDGETVVLVRHAEKEAEAFLPVRTILERHCEVGVDGQCHTKSLADALNALIALKDLGDAITLEWPKGEKLSVSDLDESGVDFSDFKTDRNWFAVRGSFKLDAGRVMDIVEMLNRWDGRAGEFVRLSNGQFVRLSESLRRRLGGLKAAGVLHKDSVEVSPAAVPMLAKEFGEAEGLPRELRSCALRLAEELKREAKVPDRLQAKLRPYQREGFVWLARHAACGFGACLADDMGLGKTLQMIALLLDRAEKGPSLVVVPASVCGNWKSEIRKFAPTLRVFFAWEFDSKDENPFDALQPGDVVVTSYGLLVSRMRIFTKRTWNGVILDEAQAIKNGVSKRARVVKEIRSLFRMAATGTPVENKLAELWSIFDFLNPGLLGPTKTFGERLTNPDGTATEGLKRLVAPFILRRLKTDVLKDLPPKTEITLPVELGRDERTAYEACRLHALEVLKGNEENRISILAELTRIRRFCCHPSLVLPDFKASAKLDALQELLTDLKTGNHRALVFSQFTDYLAIVREMIEQNGWTYQYLDGATPIAERGRAVKAFQSGAGDFFLISLKAGGMGLNLTAANYVVLLDPWWNPAVENQAADRVHRIGQQNPVTVYRLIASNTVEERVLELHQEKLRIAEDVLEGTSKSKLTPEMLMKLFE